MPVTIESGGDADADAGGVAAADMAESAASPAAAAAASEAAVPLSLGHRCGSLAATPFLGRGSAVPALLELDAGGLASAVVIDGASPNLNTGRPCFVSTTTFGRD